LCGISGEILKLKDRKFDEAEVHVQKGESSIHLMFSGDLHPEDRTELPAFFDEAVETAVENSLGLICDFRNIHLFNSTSLYTLIQFMRKVTERKVRCEFVYD